MTDAKRKEQIAKWHAAGLKHAMWCGVVLCPCRWFPISATSDAAVWEAAKDHHAYHVALSDLTAAERRLGEAIKRLEPEIGEPVKIQLGKTRND